MLARKRCRAPPGRGFGIAAAQPDPAMSSPPGIQRLDAVRNRALILDAARALVAREGGEVSMESIAGAAGLAVGTLYRHFPTKEALLGAVVEEKLRVLVAEAGEALRRVTSGGDAWSEISALFLELAQRSGEDQAVKTAVASVTRLADQALAETEQQVNHVLEQLMDAAKRAGSLRRDVSVADVGWLLRGLPGAEADEATRARCATVVLDGLRARPGATSASAAAGSTARH